MSDRPAMKLDLYTVSWQTTMSSQRVRETVRRAKLYQEDAKKKQRLDACLCVPCFYVGEGLAGQAFTSRPCAGCGKKLQSSSTYIDALCGPCAAHAELCKHCGADLHLRERRRKAVQFPARTPDGGGDHGG